LNVKAGGKGKGKGELDIYCSVHRNILWNNQQTSPCQATLGGSNRDDLGPTMNCTNGC